MENTVIDYFDKTINEYIRTNRKLLALPDNLQGCFLELGYGSGLTYPVSKRKCLMLLERFID